MQLISVNLGKERPVGNGRPGTTGIYKEPTQARVQLTRLGLVGDTVVDAKHHGGPDQAVYVYTTPDYAWWSQTLGRPVEPGIFGDNLTISDVESAQVNVGDRLHFGAVVLEVTAPRIPCSKLAARMGDPDFIARFRDAERPGLYCRVIQEGFLQTGQAFTCHPYTGETLSILQMFRDYYAHNLDEAVLRRYLAAPIAIRDRIAIEAKLQKLLP